MPAESSASETCPCALSTPAAAAIDEGAGMVHFIERPEQFDSTASVAHMEASLSKVVGEQRALRKLAVGDVAAPAPADDAAPAVEAAAEEAGDVGSWLFS